MNPPPTINDQLILNLAPANPELTNLQTLKQFDYDLDFDYELRSRARAINSQRSTV